MFNLPKSWADINVDKYKELVTITIDEFKSIYHYKLELLAILLETSADDEIFSDLDIFEMEELLDDIKWLFNEPSYTYKNEILQYKLKNLRDLTLGEFIDMEYLLKDYKNNLEKIFATLYKQYKEDEWGNKIEEPYIYNIEDRSKCFISIAINNVYGVLKYYSDWKKNFTEIFTTLFEDPDFDKIEDEDKLSLEEIQEIKEEIEKDKKMATFSWHLLIYKLSEGDITKTDQITNLSVNYIFTTLSMKKSLEL